MDSVVSTGQLPRGLAARRPSIVVSMDSIVLKDFSGVSSLMFAMFLPFLYISLIAAKNVGRVIIKHNGSECNREDMYRVAF